MFLFWKNRETCGASWGTGGVITIWPSYWNPSWRNECFEAINDLWWFIRIPWGFQGIYRGSHGIYSLVNYPLVNVYITMERSTIFNRKIHYKWAIFNSYVESPEGSLMVLRVCDLKSGWSIQDNQIQLRYPRVMKYGWVGNQPFDSMMLTFHFCSDSSGIFPHLVAHPTARKWVITPVISVDEAYLSHVNHYITHKNEPWVVRHQVEQTIASTLFPALFMPWGISHLWSWWHWMVWIIHEYPMKTKHRIPVKNHHFFGEIPRKNHHAIPTKITSKSH